MQNLIYDSPRDVNHITGIQFMVSPGKTQAKTQGVTCVEQEWEEKEKVFNAQRGKLEVTISMDFFFI